ncbi:MAG TPA: hypothetical protein VNZ53_44700 [Steroidobacteraceae bacterium]|jgi:hypothetical protein|nr:hypothetical protein [Steroidobacteraceae bacterium]
MAKGFSVTVATTIALMFEPASGGILTPGLSDTDTASFKRLAVISALGDTLMGRSMGLTVFNNKTFRTTLPNRDLDDSFTNDMKSTIAASGRIKGEVAALSTASLDTESILAAARELGFDAVVVMQPAEDTQFHMTDPGLSVWRTGGGHKSFTCNSMRIVVLRVSDGKQIASASDYRCPSYSNLPFWHDSWEEFSEAEKGAVSGAMKAFVEHQIDQTLKKLKLHAP